MPYATMAIVTRLLTAPAVGAVTVDLSGAGGAGAPPDWVFCGGDWSIADGVLSQGEPWVGETAFEQTGHAFLREPAFGDLALRFEFLVEPGSPGVGAPEVILRSTDSRTYYLIQFSTKASGVYLVRCDQQTFWADIARAYEVPMAQGEWHTVEVTATGPEIVVRVDGREVLAGSDEALRAGLIGFGSSQAVCRFRNIRIDGDPVPLDPPWRDLGGKLAKPDYRVICEDAGAGGYEAFPDICRCANGDLLCVFYAGYAHVSFPTEDLPQGARVCSVRSTDDGQTWGPAHVVADTPWDDRDPSIACLSDGTLLCNWFTYYGGRDDGRPGCESKYKELWLSHSEDHGHTWSEPHMVPNMSNAYWGCSSPIVELSDGTLLWPVYREYQDPLRNWSAVIRSTDGGTTWSDPAWVDETNDDNDEPALAELPDGRILCVMRTNRGDSMWWSISEDRGRTWTPSAKTGFRGQAPYLLRTSGGVLLLGHRGPGTSLHYSLDDGATWSGNMQLDTCIGAYPSMVELRDGTVLIVYYEEGEGSSIRAQRLRVTREGVERGAW
jgi:hypothetical protein